MKFTRCASALLISAMVLCATPFASANIRIGSAADWGTNTAWGQNFAGFESVKGWRNAKFMDEFADHHRRNFQPLSWHYEQARAAHPNLYLSLLKMAIIENPLAKMLKQAFADNASLLTVHRSLSEHELFVRITPNLASKSLGLKSLISAQMLNLLSTRWAESNDAATSADSSSRQNDVDLSKTEKTPSPNEGVQYSLPSYEDSALLSDPSFQYISRYDELLMNPAFANRCWSPAIEQYDAWQAQFDALRETIYDSSTSADQNAGFIEESYAGKYGDLFNNENEEDTTALKQGDSTPITWSDVKSASKDSWTNLGNTNLGTEWANTYLEENSLLGKIEVKSLYYYVNLASETSRTNVGITTSNDKSDTPAERGDSESNDSAGDEESNSAQTTPATLFRVLVVGVRTEAYPWFGLFHRMAAQFSKYRGVF